LTKTQEKVNKNKKWARRKDMKEAKRRHKYEKEMKKK
jgi:hypothetical protein